MKSKTLVIVISSVVLLFLILLVVSRTQSADGAVDQDLDVQSFSYKDKKPGGCYAMYQVLPHLFFSAKPQVVTKPFASTYNKDLSLRTGMENLYILVADNLYASEQDVKFMLDFARAGNQLFLAVNNPDSLLLSNLAVTIDSVRTDTGYYQHSEQHYINPHLAPDTLFSRDRIYGGRSFSGFDTTITTILGTGVDQRPNFIHVKVGDGSVFILLHPSSLTNYFLMHGNNIRSLERELAYTNIYSVHVYWDEFYKYQEVRRSDDFSEWQVLMRYPAMRWALWLAVILLLLYVLFESKRRQRIIPEKPLITNNSLEFVDALGQLYYQQHDNNNLARKMTAQWLEFIRSRFYMNTNHLNTAFMETLGHKSGIPAGTVRQIVESIHHIQLSGNISDDYLQTFYRNIQAFYLNTK